MEHIVVTWRELLMVVVLILAVYIAEVLLLMRTGGSLLRKPRWLELIRERKVESELRAEIETLQKRLDALEARVVDSAVPMPEGTPYQRAIYLARAGRDAADIAETCAISRGEAELIVSMHGAAR